MLKRIHELIVPLTLHPAIPIGYHPAFVIFFVIVFEEVPEIAWESVSYVCMNIPRKLGCLMMLIAIAYSFLKSRVAVTVAVIEELLVFLKLNQAFAPLPLSAQPIPYQDKPGLFCDIETTPNGFQPGRDTVRVVVATLFPLTVTELLPDCTHNF